MVPCLHDDHCFTFDLIGLQYIWYITFLSVYVYTLVLLIGYRIAGIYFEGINVRGFRGLSLYRENLYPRKFMNSRRVQYYGFEANGVEV